MTRPSYQNSKIPCPICAKILSKGSMLPHLKSIHKNTYGQKWWIDKYSERYEQILADNKKSYFN